jgi:hypothetical protein
MLKIIVAFSLALVTWSAAGNRTAPVKTAEDEVPVKVSLPQLAADPAAYNQKLIQVTAFVSHGFEDFAIFDPALATPNPGFSVWLEYGGKVASGTIYCCGPTDARTRPEQLTVEDIAIPLVDDSTFRQFDELIHKSSDTTVRATLIGRFFSGRLGNFPGGNFWTGYGHAGCCSLLAVQKVTAFEPHAGTDLDYRATSDRPDFPGNDCDDETLLTTDSLATIKAQQSAEQSDLKWAFTEPQRVATVSLATVLKRDPGTINGLRQRRVGPGRVVYEWGRRGRNYYFIAVRRPYWLLFYAVDSERVAWVTAAVHRISCD